MSDVAAFLGIGKGSRVIAYDGSGLVPSSRFAWVMRYYGHTDVRVLREGWHGAVRAGAEIETGAPEDGPSREEASLAPFEPRPDPAWFATADNVSEASTHEGVQVLDVRTRGEFEGEDIRGANPRGGAVPGALWLPHAQFVAPDGSLKDDADLAAAVEAAGVNLSRPVITYCQSGARAALAALVLRHLGASVASNFDGSMADYSQRLSLPLQ